MTYGRSPLDDPVVMARIRKALAKSDEAHRDRVWDEAHRENELRDLRAENEALRAELVVLRGR